MNSSQEFCLAMSAQVTAISFAAVLLMSLSRHNAATRHAVGLLGLENMRTRVFWEKTRSQSPSRGAQPSSGRSISSTGRACSSTACPFTNTRTVGAIVGRATSA